MDKITASLLKEFVQQEGLAKLPEDKQFEHFTAYLATQKSLGESFSTNDIVLGNGGDTGVDAIAVIVNGALVADPEVVEDLANVNGFLDVTFIFVQAERSSSFDTAKIGQFGFGILDFFKDKPSLVRNQKVSDAVDVMNAIYERSPRFKRGNPTCRIVYATTGKWTGDQNLEARRKSVIDDVSNLNLFREVEFQTLGADQLQKLYNESKNAVSREFTFSERTTMPEMPGISEAYLGLVPATEFMRLLEDDRGEVIKSLFYDNVRDWQDYNPVNSEMRETLKSDDLRVRFAIMNNGVTIIAKKLRPTGDRFFIEDYQIVNGCQTSHVLFNNRSLLTDKVMVPLRLIATEDETVISSIIKATNRQTEVRTEQLIALSDFPKKLEMFFESFEPARALHYERRLRQYNNVTGIEKTRIITPANLIRTFAAMFLEEPHRTTRNYTGLLDLVGRTIFNSTHKLDVYYICGCAIYQLEYLFRNQLLDAKFKPARFQILMVARHLLMPDPLPPLNSNEMERLCQASLSTWWDSAKAEDLIKRAVAIVDKVAQGNYHRDHIRTQPFTEALKTEGAKGEWRETKNR